MSALTSSVAELGATSLTITPTIMEVSVTYGPATLSTTPTASVSDTTARISFRASGAGTVAVKYSTSPDLSGSTTTSGVAVGGATDYTGKVDLAALPSNAKHYYTLLVNGVDQLTAPYPSFKTFPAAGFPAVFSFVFGSCATQGGNDSLFAKVPRTVSHLLHLGDTAYQATGSSVDARRTLQRNHLIGTGTGFTNFKALRAEVPVFTMWDDWDIENGFCGGVSDPAYAPAFTAFTEYSGKANPDSPTTGALYYSFQVGDVGFFVLDERSYRSANLAPDNASKTLLGATQLALLKDWLLTNNDTLKLKFICSPTQAASQGTTGADSWGGDTVGGLLPHSGDGFRSERNALWDYIDSNQIKGVAILSGDVHWAASFKSTYGSRPRYEFAASPFNQSVNGPVATAVDPVNGPVLWKYGSTVNFGLVTVDTTVTPATVSFQLYGPSGSLGSAYLTALTQDDIDAGLTGAEPVPMTFNGTLPGAVVSTAYSSTMTLAGDFVAPVTIDAAAGTIPSWMTVTVSGTTVTFAGTTPASAQTFNFTPRATDANSQAASGPAQSVVVSAAPVAMTLTGTLANAVAGAAYSSTLTLGGTFTAPVTIDASVGSIPAWMSASVAGNVVTFSGTAPASAETDNFTVRATDSSTTPQVATSAQTVAVTVPVTGMHIVQAKAVNAVSANAAYLEVTLDTTPAPGNHLVWLLLKGHTEYAVSFSSGTWTGTPPLPQQSSSVGVDAYIRAVGTGEGKTHRVTFATAFNAGAVLMEVAGGTGTITSVVYNVAATAWPINLTIPAGVSGALPIVWFGGYQTTNAGEGVPNAIAGWTLAANVLSTTPGNLCPVAVFSRDTLSDGSAISVSTNTPTVSNRQRAAAFLLS